MKSKKQDELVFLPLGGCGEIGMNLNAFGYGPPTNRKWVIVDVGVTFGDETTPGVDLIMADPTYLADQKENILAIVMTHGHEDHIGAIGHLWPMFQCDVYATPFTASLMIPKLAETGLEDQVPLTIVELGSTIDLAPFSIELVTLTHSILEPNALVLRTPLGTIFHTGDWKLDPTPLIGDTTDVETISKLGDENVLAMICDSTNVFNPGHSGSESDVRNNLIKLIKTLDGRVAVTTFASNVARLETIITAAQENDRHVVLVGRSMHRITTSAKDNGYLLSSQPFIPVEEAGYLPREKVLYLCTGSQGEVRAALGRVADDDHPHMTLEQGDTVIFSSRVIPGNEKSISRLYNLFAERGVEVITEKDDDIHVSGHPCRDELAQMYQWVRPRIAVPVHGEARHLSEHTKYAQELQIPETVKPRNGSLIRLAPGKAETIDQVPSGRFHLDGKVLLPAESTGIKERRKISYNGVLIAAIVVSDTGEILHDPVVSAFGIPTLRGQSGRTLVEVLEDDISQALDTLSTRDCMKDDEVEQVCRRTIRSRLKHAWGKRPQLEIQIMRISEETY